MLRAKHLLAREDRRRRRAGALQAAIVTLPLVLLAAWHGLAVARPTSTNCGVLFSAPTSPPAW
jgi:hypothetical protein